VTRGLNSLVESLPRNAWTLERFGLSPQKLRYRVANSGAPRVFTVSIPKAGTHLLERALCLHPRLYRKLLPTVSEGNIGRFDGLDGLVAKLRPGQVVASHLRFQPGYPAILESRGARGIFLIRDPHDIVVSQVHYVSKRVDHRHHDVFAGLPDMKARLRLAIAGDPEQHVSSIGERLDFFAGWLDACLVVRFEDLVGPKGGGDLDRQMGAVASMYDALSMDVDDTAVASICDRLFSSDSPTFRQGAIGGWRRFFDPELDALFDETVGDRLLAYGYPPRGGA
jgi:sulfotransferase 6B1